MSRLNPAAAAKLEAERKLKEGISGHRTGLPKRLLELFAANEPLSTLTPSRKKDPKLPYTGIAGCVDLFAQAGDDEYEPPPETERPPSPRKFRNPELKLQARVDQESRAEKKLRVSTELVEEAKEAIAKGVKSWDPAKDPNAQGDPFKTLFVARLSYEVTEKKLRREFEEYGPVKRVRLVHDKNSDKPRGYAFVEFEHKNDLKTAYKTADGKKLEGRRICVDVERGRTVPGWQPKRLGGGKGGENRAWREPKKASKRISAGLPPTTIPGTAAAPAPPREPERPPPPREHRPPPPAPARPDPRDRPRDRERENMPPPPAADGRRSDRDRSGRDTDRKRERGYEDDRSSKRPREDDRARSWRSRCYSVTKQTW
ncbi:hypothetical protein WJX73_004790 [Symbiochloris irregularis]|uniref:U1 small nuclear ribonucleoprotein 70 kDa n=1 Tax=Symbiochloris irregularis TaxID=706552 RepID=A0AAW1PRQ5_9CHLO